MRKLVVVGSTIQPREGRFTYSQTRSAFSAQERLEQTIQTINSLKSCLPEAKIVIIDSSDDYKKYQFLSTDFGVEYIPLRELSAETAEFVNNHIHKSACESLLLNTYYKQYKKEILEYDILVKATGRYSFHNFNDSSFVNDGIYFKKPLKFEWNDWWNYSLVDRRKEQDDNYLCQYCTVLYAFGTKHLDKFIDMNQTIMDMTIDHTMMHYDVETLSYYLTRQYKDIITETDWAISGWFGTSGNALYY